MSHTQQKELRQQIGNGEFIDLVVPDDYIFAMGDNRTNSDDSRVYGCIPLNKVDSKVLVRFWPLNLFGKVK